MHHNARRACGQRQPGAAESAVRRHQPVRILTTPRATPPPQGGVALKGVSEQLELTSTPPKEGVRAVLGSAFTSGSSITCSRRTDLGSKVGGPHPGGRCGCLPPKPDWVVWSGEVRSRRLVSDGPQLRLVPCHYMEPHVHLCQNTYTHTGALLENSGGFGHETTGQSI